MTDEPNSITTMKRYYGDRLYVAREPELTEELFEGNDRSLVITLASQAEAAIQGRLALSLPALKEASEKEVEQAFRHAGPFGTFSACIDIAFYMGLIDASLQGQLHDLRNMRNAVAHTKRKVSLADPQLKNVALRLLAPTGMFKLLNDTHEGLRRSLVAEGLLICTTLALGRGEAIKRMREGFVRAGREAPF